MPIRPVASVARPLARSLLTCAQRPPKATRISLISAPIAFPTPRLSARTMSSSAAATTHLPNPEPSPAGQVPGQGKPNLHLYTWGTPNGYKVSILLEELRAAYPEEAKNKLAYDMIPVDISTNVQKVRLILPAIWQRTSMANSRPPSSSRSTPTDAFLRSSMTARTSLTSGSLPASSSTCSRSTTRTTSSGSRT